MGAKDVDANGNDADVAADEGAVKLQPKLGLLNAITIVVGSIIGTLVLSCNCTIKIFWHE